jgi:NhaP-type Na+/H+ and K+/H+ antiporter
MLTIFGIKVSIEALGFFALFLASEVIGESKFKSNSIVRVLANAVGALKPLRKEDDRLDQIKKIIGG